MTFKLKKGKHSSWGYISRRTSGFPSNKRHGETEPQCTNLGKWEKIASHLTPTKN